MLGGITIALWLSSFVAGVFAFHRCKGFGIGRMLVAVMVTLSTWSASVYLFWLFGFDLKVGTISDGAMAEHWWLPPLTLLWTALSYWAFKPKDDTNSK